MITELLWLVPWLLNAGNIIYFIACFPQLWATWKNRNHPERLKGLSTKMLIGSVLAFIFFGLSGLIMDAYFTFILNNVNIIFFLLQVYWKRSGE